MSFMDIKYDPANVVSISNGDYETTDGIDGVKQDVLFALRTWLGEWFLDTRIGFPWHMIVSKLATPDAMLSYFHDAVLQRDGIQSISSFDMNFDGPSRTLSVDFEAASNLSDLPIEFSNQFILGR